MKTVIAVIKQNPDLSQRIEELRLLKLLGDLKNLIESIALAIPRPIAPEKKAMSDVILPVTNRKFISAKPVP